MITGDFNFSAPGAIPHHYNSPVGAAAAEPEDDEGLAPLPNASSIPKSSFCPSKWKKCLDKLTEISQPSPTHYHAPNLSGHVIDRVFSSAPAWIFKQLKIFPNTTHDPFNLHFRNISDHSPVSTTFESQNRLPKGSQPVQKHIFEDPLFTLTVDHILSRAPLPTEPNARHTLHKAILKIASKHVRDTNSTWRATEIHSRTTFLGAVSRAVFDQDLKLARALLTRHPSAADTFGIVNGVITIWDLGAFSAEFDCNQSGILDARLKEVESEFNSMPDTIQNHSKKKGRIAGIRRLIKLFVAIGRSLMLSGVRTPDGQVWRGDSMSDALFDSWAPTFAPKDIDEVKAKRIAERFASKMNWDLASVINLEAFIRFF